MTNDKPTFEVLRAGLDSTMNLMDEESMDLIAGGAACFIFRCGKHLVPEKAK